MLTLDTVTLFVTLFLINAVLTLMLFTFWRSQKTHKGFSTWMLSLLVATCGYFLFVIGTSPMPFLLASTVPNLLVMLSFLMRLDSTGKFFRSRGLPRILYGILVPAALLLLWFTFRVDSQLMRGIIIGVILVPTFLAASCIALQVREPETRSLRYSFTAALMVTAFLWIIVIANAIFIPGNHSLGGPDPLNQIFFIVTILMEVLVTCSFLMLNMARSQAELKESEERYRNLADNLPDYVLIHDGKFIRYANPAATLTGGSSSETLAGQPINSLISPADAGSSGEFIRALGSNGPPFPVSEIDIRLRDGTVRHCQVKTVRIDDAGIMAYLSVITDITERKTAEDALFRLNKKLTILSSVTRHDIKNQLMALSTYLELSKENLGNDPTASDYLTREMRIVQTMGHQIDFTRIYDDMGTTAPVWQNLDAGIRRAVAALPMRDVKVSVDRSDLEIYADSLFEKVSYNLIDNALKYGGDAMTGIRITCHETGTGLVVTCEDDGAGITGEDKARLFEKGYGKNTGLGLFLTREILAITGITITETGEPGKGARFEMVVPKGAYRFTGRK